MANLSNCSSVTAQNTVIGPLIPSNRKTLRYGAAVVLVLGICVLRLALAPVMGANAPLLPFMVAVIAAGCLGGLCPALLATALAPILVTPIFTTWPQGAEPLAWGAHVLFFVLVGTVVSLMIHKLQVVALAQIEALNSLRAAESRASGSAAQLRLIADAMPALIAYVDREEHLQFNNQRYDEWFGKSTHTILGNHLRDVLGEESYSVMLPRMRQALAGEHGSFEAEIPHPGSGARQIEAHYVPDVDPAGGVKGFFALVLDITARKQAEAAHDRSARHLRLLADHLPALVSYVDHEERFRFANAAYANWYALDSATLLGRTMREVLGASTYQDRQPYIRRALAGEVVRYQSDTLHHAMGLRACEISYVPDRGADGTVCGFYAMIQDITERKRAEEALRESERMLKLIYDHASDAIYLIQVEPGGSFRFLSVNEAFLSITGYARAAVEGHPIEEVIAAPHHDLAQAKLNAVLATRRPVVYDEDAQMPAGRRCTEHTLIPIMTTGYGVTHVLGTGKDVTARKQAEEALREADQRKDEFLAMLAHELRNPLAPIRNIAHVLAHEAIDPLTIQRQGQLLERQAHHLARLVDDLLDAARITRGTIELRKKTLTLQSVLDAAFETVQPLIDVKRQTLETSDCADSMLVSGDPARLAQVFGNLLANAAKYSADRAVIGVSTERRGSRGIVRVRDEGIGIDAQMLPHVFELFAQADRSLDRSEGGLGIGLTIVKALVELHGGQVEAQSAGPGRGSTFTVELPLAEAIEASPTSAQNLGRIATGLRILIVDDNRDSVESLALLLQIAGHEVGTALDGEGALHTLESFRAEIVLLDIGLPGVDGYVVAQTIRARFPDRACRLYALTGYGRNQDRALALSSGFDDHLVKPIDPAQLLELIANSSPTTQPAGPAIPP